MNAVQTKRALTVAERLLLKSSPEKVFKAFEESIRPATGEVTKKTVKAFEESIRPATGDVKLVHKLFPELEAYIPRCTPAAQNGGVLIHDRQAVKHITKDEFKAMQEAQLIKTGTGNYTRVIDEFTGTTYGITPYGYSMSSGARNCSIPKNLWEEILALFK